MVKATVDIWTFTFRESEKATVCSIGPTIHILREDGSDLVFRRGLPPGFALDDQGRLVQVAEASNRTLGSQLDIVEVKEYEKEESRVKEADEYEDSYTQTSASTMGTATPLEPHKTQKKRKKGKRERAAVREQFQGQIKNLKSRLESKFDNDVTEKINDEISSFSTNELLTVCNNGVPSLYLKRNENSKPKVQHEPYRWEIADELGVRKGEAVHVSEAMKNEIHKKETWSGCGEFKVTKLMALFDELMANFMIKIRPRQPDKLLIRASPRKKPFIHWRNNGTLLQVVLFVTPQEDLDYKYASYLKGGTALLVSDYRIVTHFTKYDLELQSLMHQWKQIKSSFKTKECKEGLYDPLEAWKD